MQVEVREHIKSALLTLLAKEDLDSIKHAAVCISAIAALEIPKGSWIEIIDALCNNA